ncbi:hypothetical protein BGZ95_001342, partial [Linnemannia exigua]
YNTALDDLSLGPICSHVKLLEWHNNPSLISKKVLTSPRLQISTEKLGSLLKRMPCLNILLLQMESDGPEPSLFASMCTLKNLKILKINMPKKYDAVPIETMFSLLSRLDELRLEESWYQHETDVLSMLEEAPWKMKRLTIDLRDMSLVRHCPHLEHLRIFPRTEPMAGRMRAVWNTLTVLLTRPTSLKGLMFYSSSQHKCLSFQVQNLSGGKSGRPHKMLNVNSANKKKWFSTEDIVALL